MHTVCTPCNLCRPTATYVHVGCRDESEQMSAAAQSEIDKRSGSVGEAEQGVLDHLGHRWMNPVLAAGDVGRGLLKAHRLDQRLNQ